MQCQWLIIHGRVLGKLFAAAGVVVVFAPLQQPHPAPCADDLRGALALRSFVANARRRPASIEARFGAVRKARPHAVPQSGQSCGSLNCAIGRSTVNGPQARQS